MGSAHPFPRPGYWNQIDLGFGFCRLYSDLSIVCLYIAHKLSAIGPRSGSEIDREGKNDWFYGAGLQRESHQNDIWDRRVRGIISWVMFIFWVRDDDVNCFSELENLVNGT
jgi:hypothetical protein